MRISISYMEEKKKNQYPRLLAKDSKEFSTVKFQKIEFYTKIPKQVDTTRVVLKSLHKTRDSIHSFKLINVQDSTCRERRKSDSDGVMSTKIIHLDLQYPKTMIQQHQFLDKVKDLRRRAIKGRMKTKFQKSIKCMGTTQVSSFNPQHQHTYSSRDSVYGSLQDIKVLRTFAKDRPYYQRPLDKRCSEFAAESPGSPSVQVQRTERKIIFARKQKTFVLLQLSKYKLKPFEQLKRDTIIKLLSDTKETQPHTPAIQTRSTIQNKLQPYFCFPKKRNTKRSCFTSQSQRFKTSS